MKKLKKLNREQKLGLFAIGASFAVLFGVVGYINLTTVDHSEDFIARTGMLWTYEVESDILSMDTDVPWGLIADGQVLYGTAPEWASGLTYFVSITYCDDGDDRIVLREDFDLEVL